MSWVKFDDQFNNHPKILEAGPLAVALHMRAIVYCGQYLTDGLVRPKALDKILDWDDDAIDFASAPENRELAARLVNAGMWREADNGPGWTIHDYLKYNPSREKVLTEREAAAERQRKRRGLAKDSADVTPSVTPLSRRDKPEVNPPRPDPDPDPIPYVHVDTEKPSPLSHEELLRDISTSAVDLLEKRIADWGWGLMLSPKQVVVAEGLLSERPITFREMEYAKELTIEASAKNHSKPNAGLFLSIVNRTRSQEEEKNERAKRNRTTQPKEKPKPLKPSPERTDQQHTTGLSALGNILDDLGVNRGEEEDDETEEGNP